MVRPADPQKRARIMNTLKSRKALYAGSRPDSFSLHMDHEQRQQTAVISLSLVFTIAPFRPRYETTPFLLSPLPFPSSFFPGPVLRCFPPSPLPGSDQSMQDFCVDWPDWRTALPSMGTKTCRQHREQETTNCCKLKNTNAHLSGRVLHLSRAFFRHVLVFCLDTFVRSTREYVPLVSLLLLIVQFYLYFLLNVIPSVSASCR